MNPAETTVEPMGLPECLIRQAYFGDESYEGVGLPEMSEEQKSDPQAALLWASLGEVRGEVRRVENKADETLKAVHEVSEKLARMDGENKARLEVAAQQKTVGISWWNVAATILAAILASVLTIVLERTTK